MGSIFASSIFLLILGQGFCRSSSTVSDESKPTLKPTEKELIRCKRPMCAMYCPDGFAVDSRGCETCRCKVPPTTTPVATLDPCETDPCPAGTMCEPINCSKPPCERHCIGLPCPLIMCPISCPSGYKKNKQGCDSCECKPVPKDCSEMICPADRTCSMKEDKCTKQPCLPKPQCLVKSLCNMVRDSYSPLDSSHANAAIFDEPKAQRLVLSPHKYQCNKDGSFTPKQCHHASHECWCVDDRGTEMHHTRTANNQPDLNCHHNKTSAVSVQFRLAHQLPHVERHATFLQTTIHEHVSRWLITDKEHITQVNIDVVTVEHQILLNFIVLPDGQMDLASSVDHMKRHLAEHVVLYRGAVLRPIPETLHMRHHYHGEGLGRPRIAVCFENLFSRKWYDHYWLFTAAGATVLFILLTAVTIRCYRIRSIRRNQFQHQRLHDNYTQNIIQTAVLDESSIIDEKKKMDLNEPTIEVKT